MLLSVMICGLLYVVVIKGKNFEKENCMYILEYSLSVSS